MSTPSLRVDPASSVPPYEQIRRQVADRVSSGVLRAGDRLPPVRTLAAELGVAANTAARAYKELEAAGVVVTGRRAGTVVADGVAASERAVARQAAEFAAAARAAGLDEAAALDLVRRALRTSGG